MKNLLTILAMIFLLSFTAACQPAATPQDPTSTFTPLPLATIPPSHTPQTPATTPTETAQPAPTETPTVTFAVIGDYGSAGPHLADVAALIDSWQVDFILTTGDNNYPIGSPTTIDENIGQYFHSYIFPYKGDYGSGADTNRFFPSMGNHDWQWLLGQPYLDYFDLPGNERYYEIEWEFVHLFAISSDWAEPDGIGKTSPQADWLQTKLLDSTAPWQIVYFHHAPYSSGHHGPTEHMQWPFHEWGADVVLSGHDHHYERLTVDDLTYFIVGNSGGEIYNIPSVYPGSQFRYREDYGALRVTATQEVLLFEFFNVEGDRVDQYSLTHPR
jgi:hypothetical protein